MHTPSDPDPLLYPA